MGYHKRPVDPWRVRLYVSLIKQVRGKPLLEALFRLQHGLCAYDEEPCALLLPQVGALKGAPSILREQTLRYATVDHVVPRALGGENVFTNYVMASQDKNGQKGALAPTGIWVPKLRHTSQQVERTIRMVEELRWNEATRFALDRKMCRQRVVEKLILRELRRLGSGRDFKFYDEVLAA